MTDETDALEAMLSELGEPPDLAEWDEVDLTPWPEVDLSRWDEVSLGADSPPRRRQPGARSAAVILDRIAAESRRATHPAARFDAARIEAALSAAASALRSGDDWRRAVSEVYSAPSAVGR